MTIYPSKRLAAISRLSKVRVERAIEQRWTALDRRKRLTERERELEAQLIRDSWR